MALVIATAVAVASVIVVAVNRQIEQVADRRLADGSTFFQASLESRSADLLTAGKWLGADGEFAAAVQEDRHQDVQARLAIALLLQSVDEVIVAGARGDVIAQLRIDQPAAASGSVADESGFHRALAGRSTSGIVKGSEGFLRQAVYVPVPSPTGGRPAGVVRVASFLDEKELDRFRARTGLDASLFFGDARIVTTLRQPDGRLITGVSADPAVYREVVDNGREVHVWGNLPIGQVRSYAVPLSGPDGSRDGMLSIALPTAEVVGGWRGALLPVLPVTLLIVFGGALFAYLLSRRITRPMVLLGAAAARLRNGDFSTPVPSLAGSTVAPLAEQLELARRGIVDNLEATANVRARWRAFFAALRDPVLIASPDGHVVGFNPAAAELLGGGASR